MKTTTSFDLIGDIHGCADTLQLLLQSLGYDRVDGVFEHPSRKVIFLGDFVDRGPLQRRVIEIVRPMIDSGSALSVMGNHEFNAIAYATARKDGDGYLRPHSDKNRAQHDAFLHAYQGTPEDYAEVIDWFKTLPLWLDLGSLRVVHACWDMHWISRIQAMQGADPLLSDELLVAASDAGTWQFEAIETLLKGKEIPLPTGHCFHDKDGHPRHHMRVRWWDQGAITYQQAFMGSESALTHIPDDDIAGDHLLEYSHQEPPVFLGHYWMEGEPDPLATNIACLDYSVARRGGKLVAYRWDGEQQLSKDKFHWVERQEAS